MSSEPEVIDLIETYIKNTNERDNKPELTSKNWYLPNRAGFVKSIHSIFNKYELKKQEEGNTDLDKGENNKLDLFPHQKFVRDYLQEDSPSRGLLLYHGLGVGKTCASIATAELLATNRNISVLLPASLEINYINEVLKCGHPLYSQEQNWSFVNHKAINKLGKKDDVLTIMDEKDYNKNGGFWLSRPNKKSNYKKYNEKQKDQINRQLQSIIRKRYNILHYNGLNNKRINQLTEDDTINPFDNSIVIIDEVHNFISRVINGSKIGEKVYELIYNAKKCKVLCLSGTPLINRPLELAFLVNLIKRATIEYKMKTNESLDDEKMKKLEKLLDENKYIDHYNYDALEKNIILKLVPVNFSKNKDFQLVRDDKNVEDMKTLKDLKAELTKNEFKFILDNKANEYQPLPTNEDKFNKLFINEENGKIKNVDLLTKRILGSISHFVYSNSELFPEIRTNEVVEVEISEIQLKKYIDVRNDEIRKESKFKKDSDANQVYKAFSRALCNFTFPEEIERPYPSKLKLLLSDMDVVDDYHKKIQEKLVKFEKKTTSAPAPTSTPTSSKPIEKYFKFNSKSKEGKSLSNFADIKVVVNGKTYITGEHAFQGEKYILASKKYQDDEDGKLELINYAKKFEGKDTEFKKASDAKKSGDKKEAKLENNEIKKWKEKDADEVQKEICLYKYENNLEVRELLNKYKDKTLIHQDDKAKKNTPWSARVDETKGTIKEGKEVIIGQNKLGKSWMNLVRIKIHKKNKNPNSLSIPEVKKINKDIIESQKFSSKNYNEDDYTKKIQEILNQLYDNKEQYLVKDLQLYSPKFHKILENLGKTKGSALIYSQFRTVEGIGVLKMVLKANGYAEFKIKKVKNTYVIDIDKEDYNKPKYAEFTGDKDITSILLDIFNNELSNVPKEIVNELDNLHSKEKEINNGNLRGSLIKVMMITQSGSEGISLKNVRQVHLVEPYWNMVRMDQVIGRAARTGSHLALPKTERNIDVFKYLSSFSKEHLKERKIQKMDNGRTTDQVINSIAEKKAEVMNSILNLLKSSAVDCHLHKKNHPDVECFSYPINIKENELVTKVDIEKEELDYMKEQREKQIQLDLNIIEIKDIKYMILFDNNKKNTGQLFDKDEYDKFETIKFVGLLLKNDKNEYLLRLVKE
tara:strand:- start:54 stop:3497 length:3444 start_codon:yes stop_codon:yes gene_type:complete